MLPVDSQDKVSKVFELVCLDTDDLEQTSYMGAGAGFYLIQSTEHLYFTYQME